MAYGVGGFGSEKDDTGGEEAEKRLKSESEKIGEGVSLGVDPDGGRRGCIRR